MLSYQNNPATKTTAQNRFTARRVQDRIEQVSDSSDDDCFIGRFMDFSAQETFANTIGPDWLALLASQVYKNLPAPEAQQFGADFLAAIPVGADLEPARYRFLLTVQHRNLARISGNPEHYAAEVRAAISGVIAYLEDPDPESAEFQSQRNDLLAILRECGTT